MLELLKFDRKQLRAILNTLKGDKFIKCRMRVETAADGKTTRHNFYFINYRLLVNVVKYKLDHMRRRIETDERDSTNRASFRCPICSSTFTDLEANQLFEPNTGIFRCTFCETEVEEDESAMPKKDARTLVARFNEQIEPIYALLRETEDVNLAYELLEPEPMEILALKQSKERAVGALGNSLPSGQHREAWTTKGPSYGDMYTQNVIINMEDQEDTHQPANEGKLPRERPVWLRESTVQGAYDPNEVTEGGQDINMSHEGEEGQGARDNNEEVMRALLIHEKKTSSASTAAMGGIAPLSATNASDSESETSESDEDSLPCAAPAPTTLCGLTDDNDEDEFEVVTEDPIVMVAGHPFSYSQVNQRPELVTQMTLEEKEQYIAMGQRMFEDMFD